MTFDRDPAQIAELNALLLTPGTKATESVDIDAMNRQSMAMLSGQGMLRPPGNRKK